MKLGTLFIVLTFATAFVGFASLVSTGQVHSQMSLIYIAVFVGAIIRRKLGFQLPIFVWNIISTAVFCVALYGWMILGQRMYSVVYFFFYLELYKLLTAQSNRDYLQVYVLSFFHMLAASVSTESIIFAPMLALYVFLIIAAMMVFTIKRDAEETFKEKKKKKQRFWRRKRAAGPTPVRLADLDEDSLREVAVMRIWDKRTAFAVGGLTLSVLVLGTVIFWIVPRAASQNFLPGLQGAAPQQRKSAFGDNIQLGGIGEIQNDPTIVMRGTPLAKYVDSRPAFLRIRGSVLDHFTGREWSRTQYVDNRTYSEQQQVFEFASTSIPPHLRREREFSVRMTLEPESSQYYFLVDHPVSTRLEESTPMEINEESLSLKRVTPRFHTVSYFSTGYLPEEGLSFGGSANRQPINEQGVPTLLAASLERFGKMPRQIFGLIQAPRDDSQNNVSTSNYLQLPDSLDVRTAEELALEWTEGLTSNYEKAKTIEQRFQNDFDYSLDIDFSTRQDHLSHFLTERQEGHCEYFATSMVLMLRSQRIPARIVNGYLTDEWSNNRYIVRQEHAHSWVEAQLDPSGQWTMFDPTPPSGVGSNRIKAGIYHFVSSWMDGIKVFWYERYIDYNQEDQKAGIFATLRFLRSLSEASGKASSGVMEFFNSGDGPSASGNKGRILFLIVGVVIALIIGGVVSIVIWLIKQSKKKQDPKNERAPLEPPADVRPYVELVQELQKLQPRNPAQTPQKYAQHIAKWSGGALQQFIVLTEHYYNVRYNGASWSHELNKRVEEIRVALRELPPAAETTEKSSQLQPS